ncbi:fumarylacetoacetate hydrolase family protein [Polaromonas sp.]|uniref:fumarylacetoacetate hydrolase family protein n=1 Tax=Polaromonas sp. TaxID=1869339 RepID=UPI00345A48CC
MDIDADRFYSPSLSYRKHMKYQLFRFAKGGKQATGMLVNDKHFDLNGLSVAMAMPTLANQSIDALLEDWSGSHLLLKELAKTVAGDSARASGSQLEAQVMHFKAPLGRPGVIYAAGANYRDHVEAMGRAFNMKLVLDPKAEGVDPWHFIKAGRGTLSGHGESVAFPPHTQKLDWEAELAVVIGKTASKVSVGDALSYVAGYSCANDLSARDNLTRAQVDQSSPFRFDWIGHKCFTGACPVGPYLTPAEFVTSPESLGIKLWVNDVLKQDSNTSNHLYGVAEQISYLSHRLDLYPGDILLTGTPAGVGMETGTFIAPGDVLKVWVEGLGELKTQII